MCTLRGQEEPTATSTNFDLGVFSQMYHEERRRRLQEESHRQHATTYLVPDIEMINGGIDVVVLEDDDPDVEFNGEVLDQGVLEGGSEEVETEVEEEL